MLKRVGQDNQPAVAALRMSQASFPAPFPAVLEYGAPARGAWNIVHTGMLIPEVHQIFVCAAGCLRGVVLTAAEMGASDRFSTVTIRENNVLDGDMEDLIVEGVTDILNRLPKLPPAVLVYTSCIHHFMGCDLPLCYRILGERFPGVAFTDCYMNPIMRKSGLTPDQLMRRQLYSLLTPKEEDPKSCSIVGNDLATDESSDLVRMIRGAGYALRDVTLCRTYEEYQDMARSAFHISTQAPAKAGGDALSQELGRPHLYLPLCYGADEIRRHMTALADKLGVDYDGGGQIREEAERALAEALEVIGQTPISIDYTATPRPLSLARMLLEHGFRVERLYIDAFSGEEKEDFLWLQANAPDVWLLPTVHPTMRVAERAQSGKTLAIGQKAAYFTDTRNFVNIVEGGGMYGFDGIAQMARRMVYSFQTEQDTRQLIQQKGLGCTCCL